LLKQFPDSTTLKNFYAYYLAQQNKNLLEALELSSQTIKSNPKNTAYLDTYGYILFKLNRPDEAEKYLIDAYHKQPFEEEIMEHLADLYRKTNRPQKIKEMYRRAIDTGVDFKNKLLEKLKDL